jgi:hypothetical protein
MKLLKVEPVLTEKQANDLKGEFLDVKLVKHHVCEDTKIVNSENETIAIYKKRAIPEHIIRSCRRAFRRSISKSNNRGQASGPLPSTLKIGDKFQGLTVGKLERNRFYPLLASGKLSNSPKARNVESAVIGYNDRYPRIPYCRRTMFTQNNWSEYLKCLPYVEMVNDIFKQEAPVQYARQKMVAEKTEADFIIKDTAFSTVTVNRNFRTAGHVDNGDYKPGLGNLGVIARGNYEGAITVLPRYGIGLDVKNGDVALFNVHEVHGNTAIVRKGYCERISIVCYYREKMLNCGNTEYELERAKKGKKSAADQHEIVRANRIKKEVMDEFPYSYSKSR